VIAKNTDLGIYQQSTMSLGYLTIFLFEIEDFLEIFLGLSKNDHKSSIENPNKKMMEPKVNAKTIDASTMDSVELIIFGQF